MADVYYAWSPIRSAETNKENPKTVTLNPGDKVDKATLFITDEQWDQLVESGAVRTMKYPDVPNGYQDSPINFLLQQAKDAAEGALNDANTSTEAIQAAQLANEAASGVPAEQPTT